MEQEHTKARRGAQQGGFSSGGNSNYDPYEALGPRQQTDPKR